MTPLISTVFKLARFWRGNTQEKGVALEAIEKFLTKISFDSSSDSFSCGMTHAEA